MPTIDLQLLGTPAIRDGTRPGLPHVLVQPKRLALFAYLTLAAPRGFHRRDKLLALFWPERSEAEARAALSDALYFLRGRLGAQVIVGRGAEEVGVAGGEVRCDALEFDHALETECFAEAVTLYSGDLLDGFHLSGLGGFERWMDTERARLRGGCGRALEQLAEAQERGGEMEAALESLRRLGALDPYDSRRTLLLVDALVRAGSPAAALLEAEAHATLLRSELGMEPPELLTEVTHRLRTVPSPADSTPLERVPAAPPVAARPGDGGPGSGEVREPAQEEAVPAEPAVEAAAPGNPPLSVGPRTRARRSGRMQLLAGGAGLVGLSLLVLWVAGGTAWNGGTAESTAGLADPYLHVVSIAVLPFLNLSPDPEDDHFSDGVTEEITNALTAVPGLGVAARTSAFAWKGTEADVTEIGRRLNVTHLLQGSVRRDGPELRIAVQLVDAGTGLQLWSRSFDRRMENVFQIQDEISEAILRELGFESGAPAADRPAPRRSTDLRAYDLYLLGRQLADTGREAELLRATRAFVEALEIDPSFAPALAGLARTYIRLGITYRPADEMFPHARRAAEQAIELDSLLASPHAALAFLRMEYDWDWEGAERSFRHALALAPGSADSHGGYQGLLRILNRCEESIAHGRRAAELDPLAAILIADLGLTYYYCRRFDEAVEAYERSLRLDETRPATHLRLAMALGELGRYEEALIQARRAVEIAEGHTITLATLGKLSARAGRREEATDIARDLEVRARAGEHVDGVHMGALYTGLDDPDTAMEWLLRAWEQRSSSLVSLAVHPWHDPLRGRPDFQDLLRRMALE